MGAPLVLTTTGPALTTNLVTDDGQLLPVSASPGSGPAVSATSVFVFRPGGVAAGNVYTSWATMLAAVALVAGPKWISFDTSLAPCTVPAGTWNVDQCTIAGIIPGSTLTFLNGAHLTFLQVTFGGGCIFTNTGATAVATLTSPLVIVNVTDASLSASGAGHFFDLTAGFLEVVLIAGAFLAAGSPVLGVAAGLTAVALMTSESQFANGTLSGLGTVQAQLTSDCLPGVQGGLTTYTVVQASNSNQDKYTPAVLANWSGTAPTSVANALDRIAAKITPIP
jgi:hypothetical protein